MTEDKKFEEYVRSLREMFRSSGWEALLNDLKQNAVGINSVEATKDSESLYFRKGQLNILAHIINLEAQIDAVEEQRNNAEEEEEEGSEAT